MSKRDFPTNQQLKKALNINFKVVVPSTRDKTIPISRGAFERRIDETSKFLTNLFYGSTISKGFGTYTHKGKVIKEKVMIFNIFTTGGMYNKNDKLLEKFIVDKRNAWGQEDMAFEYEEKLLFI